MDNFREWLSDNLRYILLGLAVALVAVIIVCVVRLAGGSSGKTQNSGSANRVTESAERSSEEAGVSSSSQSLSSDAATTLKKDDEAILTLVTKYYNAVVAKDTATLATIVDPWNEEIEQKILAGSVIESYDHISTYSEPGPSDGTYVVYAYYDGKIRGISTEAPSLALLYVVTNDSGTLVVGDRNASTEVADYISRATASSDVQALKNDVNQKLLDAEASDPDLKAFLDRQSSGQEETEDSTEDVSGGSSSGSGETATTTAGVNIRAEASADSQILGVTYAGAEVTVVERGDEWSHIRFEYQGTVYDGYVATQYLDFGSGSSDSSSADAAGGESSSSTAAQTGASSGQSV